MADFSSIIGEKVFTFEVGPSNEKIQMHPSIVRGISQPLYALMTNGRLGESIKGVAHLPEIYPEAFWLFVQWAYSRTYQNAPEVPTPDPAPKLDKDLELKGLSEFYCHWCGENCEVKLGTFYPFCSLVCAKTAVRSRLFDGYVYCIRCKEGLALSSGPWHDHLSRLCVDCHDSRVALFEGTSCTVKFAKLDVGFAAHTMENFLKLQPSLTSKEPLMQPLLHAKLYVLADMYLIDELKQLTLRRLHQDLTRMAVTEANRRWIKELLLYTYNNTASIRAEDTDLRNAGGEKHDLRTLVLTYVLEHSRVMTNGEDMADAIGTHQDLLRDVLAGLAARTKTSA